MQHRVEALRALPNFVSPEVKSFTHSNLWRGLSNKHKNAAGSGMSAEEEHFQVGERVRLSDLGRQRMPRSKATSAKVVGYGRSETRIRVVFEGSTYPVSIHISYLERDE